MELEKNPCSPYLPALPPCTQLCLSPEPAQISHCWVLPHQWRGLGPRRQDSFQPWLSGRSARHRAAEAHTVISSPKPQAVPSSVKCDLSRAAAGPSKQAIFMK